MTEPHRLTSNVNRIDHQQGDAKKLCQRLLALPLQADPSQPRVIDCIEAPLATLERHGQHAGIAEFLESVRSIVLPLIGDR